MLALNLLPPTQKRNLAIIWRARVLVLVGTGVGVVVAVGILLLLPTYFLIGFQTAETVRAAQLERQAQAQSGIEEQIANIRAANRIAETVNRYQAERRAVFPLFETIMRSAGGSVRIEEMEFKSGARQFTLRGFAPTRQDLLSFVAALEASEAVADVSSPVTNLIREVSISFSLTIALR